MKTAETKSGSRQQQNTAAKSFFNQGQEQAFFSEQASEHTPFFPSTAQNLIQTKSISGQMPFFSPSNSGTIQAKCTTCEAEEQSQAEVEQVAEPPTVQRMSAFESEGGVQTKVLPGVGAIAPPPTNPKSQPNSDIKELEQQEEAIAETPQIQMMPAFSSADDGDDSSAEQPPVQFSLKIGQLGDAYEREADAMADRVVAMSGSRVSDLAPKTLNTSQPHQVNSKQTVGMRSLMRQQAEGNPTPPAPKNLESRLQAQGSGSPLDASTRAEMEGAFDADFGGVQIHTGQEAATLNQDLGARAFTHRNKIFFNSGEYQPQSQSGKHLLAHELTHTIQQGQAVQRKVEASPSIQPNQTTPNLQKAPTAAGNQPTLSSEVVDVSGNLFNPSDKVKAEIEAQGSKGLDVRVIINGVTSEGRVKIKLDNQGNYSSIRKGYLPLLNSWAQKLGEMYINFTVKNNNIAGGYASLKQGADESNDWLQALQKNSSLLGGAGLKVENLPKPINKLENGKLTLGVNNLKVEVGGYVDAQFNLLLENTNKPKIDATAQINNVKGVEGELKLDNTQDKLTGEASLALTVKAFKGEAKIKYNPDGTVDIGGKGAYNANKLSGEIQFVATDLETANRFGKDAIAAAGGKENVQNASPPAPVPLPKSGKKERALAATGQLAFNLTTWFAGTVNVVVDGKGDVTVIGKIAPPAEIELFQQRDWDKELIKFEARAYYGVPLVGNLNVFANISLHALAKLGPAKIYNIEILGTYSTDPEIQKNIQISGSINISAYAGLRLRAEGGAGIELVGHDLKFGVGLNADVGVKAYADARPTIGYRDPGVFYISGTLEMVAQPMLGLSGDFFIELDSPWWSPAPDKKWIWPLFSKEWPLTDPIGISATLKDYELGSGQVPDVELKKPEFDPSKFMTSMIDNNLPDKSGGQATGQGTFKEDGSVLKPTVPPKKPEPKKADAKPGKKGAAPPQGGKSAAPDPKAAAAQNSMKLLADAAKQLASLKAKAPFTHADLNKELAKIKGQVSGVDFAVQPKGEMWVIIPKVAGKTGNRLELAAKDAKGGVKETEETGKAGEPFKPLEVPFSMNAKQHTLFISSDPATGVEVASQRDKLSTKIGRAIAKLMKQSPKPDIQIDILKGIGSKAKTVQNLLIKRDRTLDETTAMKREGKAIATVLSEYGRKYDVADIEEILNIYPPPKVGLHGTLTGEGPLPDGTTRESHHAPPVELAVSMANQIRAVASKVKSVNPEAEQFLLNAVEKLVEAEQGHGKNLPAILVHHVTHKNAGVGGVAIHSKAIRQPLENWLSAKGADPEKMVKMRSGSLASNPTGEEFEKFFGKQRYSKKYKQGTLNGVETKELIAETWRLLDEAYSNVASQTLASVELAVSSSKVDGQESERKAAVRQLRNQQSPWTSLIRSLFPPVS